ncbi:MAG TPA: outer membrane beta-barrel protein [Burkholderiales bacterium]
MKVRLVAAVFLVTAGLTAGQVSAADSGGYFGVAAGQSMVDLDEGEINASLASIGLGANTTVDDTDTGFKIFGGYQFNNNLAIEGAYSRFGKFASNSTITSGGSGTANGEWSGYSLDVAALGMLPLGEKFTLFGRAGLSVWNLDFDFTASGPGGTATLSESESGVSPLLGLGASFNFTPTIALRAEYERHFAVGDEETTGDGDIDLISVGLVFKF